MHRSAPCESAGAPASSTARTGAGVSTALFATLRARGAVSVEDTAFKNPCSPRLIWLADWIRRALARARSVRVWERERARFKVPPELGRHKLSSSFAILFLLSLAGTATAAQAAGVGSEALQVRTALHGSSGWGGGISGEREQVDRKGCRNPKMGYKVVALVSGGKDSTLTMMRVQNPNPCRCRSCASSAGPATHSACFVHRCLNRRLLVRAGFCCRTRNRGAREPVSCAARPRRA